MMGAPGRRIEGVRLRALIVILWRAGLRISEALSLAESDLDPDRGSILVRHGKGDKRRQVGMDRWGSEQLRPWADRRVSLPVGNYFCVIHGPTAGRPWAPSSAREELHAAARRAGVRRRFAPHQLRHAHAVEMSREGVPLVVIQRQLGHADLSVTSVYLRGIDNTEIIDTVHERRPPMIPATPACGSSDCHHGRAYQGTATGASYCSPGAKQAHATTGAARSSHPPALVTAGCRVWARAAVMPGPRTVAAAFRVSDTVS